jgi:hypothetical protein
MLNTAIGLFGIHYVENLNHWMGWNHAVDYSHCIKNNQETVFNHYNTTFYSHTYFSKKINELVEDYKFKSLKLKPISNERSDNYRSKNISVKETIKLILEDNVEYDVVILMRYDMIFHQNLIDLNIDYNKVNMLCLNKCGSIHDLCDDSFYLLPFSKLQEFYDTIDKIDVNASSHAYNKHIEDINYMVDGAYYTHEYPMYHVLRTPLS